MNKSKYIKVIGSLLLISILFHSCLVTKKYEPPQIEERSYLFRLDSLLQDGEPINSFSWQEYYQDSVLQQYIEDALINNIDNKIAFKNIERFEALMKQGKMGYLPAVNLNADVQRQAQAGNSQFGSFFSDAFYQYTLSGNISWEADLWGKITSQKLAAMAQFDKSLTAQKTLQTTLIANVANTYYQLLAADRRRDILLSTIDVRNQSYNTIQSLMDAGKGNMIAVSQTRAQIEDARIQLTDLDNQIFQLENALALLVGKSLPVVDRGRLETQEVREEFYVGLPAKILSNRPDVKEAELEFRSLFENYNVASASLYPTITLSANLGFQSLQPGSWLSKESFFNTLMGGIAQPIFDRGRLKTQKAVAKYDMENGLLRFEKKIMEAGVEVSNSLKTIEVTAKNISALQSQEALLLQSLEDAKELLKHGLADYLEVLNAQTNLLNTQLQLAQMKSQYLISTSTLYRAVGGGQ